MNGHSKSLNILLAGIDGELLEKIGAEALAAAVVLIAGWWLSRVLRRLIERRFRQGGHSDEDAIRVYKSFVRFLVMATALVLALHVFGINMSTLFTTGGLFAVAMAFAMKNLSENLIAGIILRLERSIKHGDVVETAGRMVRIEKIGFRATLARTKDERDLVIPNSQIVQSEVANYTLKDSLCRVVTSVGVAYSSDIRMVHQALERVCERFDWTSPRKNHKVRLTSLEESAMRFQVQVWIDDPWGSGGRRSEMNEAIVKGLEEAGITISFPQLDVHIDGRSPVRPDFEEEGATQQ